MRPLFLLGLCAILRADQYPRQPGIDVQHYIFKVTLSDDTDEIEGDATIRVKFIRDDVKRVALDFASGMAVTVRPPAVRTRDQVIFPLEMAPKTGEIREFSLQY